MERPSFILYCYINYPGRIAYKKDAVHAGTNRKNNLGSLFAIAMRPCKSIANSLPFCAIKITQDRVWEYPNSQLHSSVIDHYFNPYFRLVYVSFFFYCFIWRKFFSFSFYVCTATFCHPSISLIGASWLTSWKARSQTTHSTKDASHVPDDTNSKNK